MTPRKAVPVSTPARAARSASEKPTARVSLRDHALAALALFVSPPEPPASEAPEMQFLRQRTAALGVEADTWLAAFHETLARPTPGDVSLVALARDLDLSDVELLAVVLAEAVESDAMIGRVVAHLQAPIGASRPTVGLLSAAFSAVVPPGGRANDLIVAGPASASGLLVVAGDGAPLPERAISVPVHLCLALHGADALPSGASLDEHIVLDVPLAPSVHALVARHAAALDGSSRRLLVIRSSSPSENQAVAYAVAAAMRRRPLFIGGERGDGLAPLLRLRGLLPVFSFELGPGEHRALPDIPLYRGPVLALCGPDGTVDTRGWPTAHWTLPFPPAEERRELWAASLDDPMLAADLASNHRHGAGRIAHLSRLARHNAAVDGRERATLADVAAAAWTVEGGGLDALAQPIPDLIPDEAFVTTPALRDEMQHLLLRCRVRDGLVSHLGASAVARYHPGVRALFIGPSGTGKTLAAGWLATKLGAPLYRVDLAAVTSKYIGETEKNLAQLLARAEQAEVVLLFDEADSLFGKRTDVRDANDRFANAQTNYLLQRIETYEGIALLTSNSRSRFDGAFARRLDAIVDFPLPGPEERRLLWQSHLGMKHGLTARELNLLAARVDVAGGHIRNIVLAAAVMAHGDDERIHWTQLVRGVAGEYRKLGRQVPAELQAAGDGQ
jgi:ATPase family associated with various cellular activities (AAA)